MKTNWVTMITPYAPTGEPDREGIAALVDWYASNGVDGIFAVCQSSEIHYLSQAEREAVRDMVVEAAAGRMQVMVSGGTSFDQSEYKAEIKGMADGGASCVVLFTNILYGPDDGDDEAFLRHTDELLTAFPKVPFSLYEIPKPHKRLISDRCLRFCAQSGRFLYMKDTSCDGPLLSRRAAIVGGTPLQLLNANAATLLPSLLAGADGYCGVMDNFHPDLYSKLMRLLERGDMEKANRLAAFLSVFSMAEVFDYPLCAKYYLSRQGLPILESTRVPGVSPLKPHQRRMFDDMMAAEQALRGII